MSVVPTLCSILFLMISGCLPTGPPYGCEQPGSNATGAQVVPVVLTVTDPIQDGDITLRIRGVPDSEHSVVTGDAAGASQQGGYTFAVGGEVQVFPVITTDLDGWGSWTGPLDTAYRVGDTLRFQAIATDAALVDHPASRVVIREVVTDVVAPPMRNVLILLADDMGVDRMAIYDGPDSPDYLAPTPNLDALAEEGLVFTNMWSMHVCGATRTAMQTGRYPRRTGWGTNADIDAGTIPIVNNDDPELDAGFITLGELVSHSPWYDYATAHIGKWQINTPYSDTSFELGSVVAAVHSQGYEWFQGTIIGVESWFGSTAAPNGLSYFKFGMFENDESYVLMDGGDATYATTVQAADAVDWLAIEAPIDMPWLLTVAFNAPHDPHHIPPDALYTGLVPTSDTEKQIAAIEAMDTEIGSILDVVDLEDTLVIFMSDNGTAGSAAGAGELAGRMKNTVYEGGIHVPLIVAGAGLSPDFSNDLGEVDFTEALVSVVDLFPTIAEIVGVDPTELPSNLAPESLALAIDGVSFAGILDGSTPEGLRETAYAERFEPGGSHEVWGYDIDHMAIRDATHKLIWDGVSDTEIGFFVYDAEGHEVEVVTLTADDVLHYDALKAEMDSLREGLVYDSAQWPEGPAIAVNEFRRDTTFDSATGNEWIEVVLVEDLAAAELETFHVGDSNDSTEAKFSGYRFTDMDDFAAEYPAGTIIVVAGGLGPPADLSYDPAAGDWNLVLPTGDPHITWNGTVGDLAGSDVAYVDTNGTNRDATLTSRGMVLNYDSTPGAFGAMAIVTIGSPTKGTGDANMAGFDDAERVSSWTTSIAMSSQTPGQPNGGDNTTAIDELRAQFCADPDDDALCDDVDLCPDDFDPTNADTDADGVGDSCDVPAVLLDAAPGMAGSNNTFTVVDGPLNADVKYYYGSTIGSTSVTLACGTVTMDLQNAKLVGQAVTDASGTAALTTNIPSQLAGKVMQTQAVFPGFCFKTNVDATQF